MDLWTTLRFMSLYRIEAGSTPGFQPGRPKNLTSVHSVTPWLFPGDHSCVSGTAVRMDGLPYAVEQRPDHLGVGLGGAVVGVL